MSLDDCGSVWKLKSKLLLSLTNDISLNREMWNVTFVQWNISMKTEKNNSKKDELLVLFHVFQQT
jgi:hypothetical protein